jgi:hypothetical protein
MRSLKRRLDFPQEKSHLVNALDARRFLFPRYGNRRQYFICRWETLNRQMLSSCSGFKQVQIIILVLREGLSVNFFQTAHLIRLSPRHPARSGSCRLSASLHP